MVEDADGVKLHPWEPDKCDGRKRKTDAFGNPIKRYCYICEFQFECYADGIDQTITTTGKRYRK